MYILLFLPILAHNQLDEVKPEFLAALGNMSVTQGRDISFTCVVNNLGPYKVSKVLFDVRLWNTCYNLLLVIDYIPCIHTGLL